MRPKKKKQGAPINRNYAVLKYDELLTAVQEEKNEYGPGIYVVVTSKRESPRWEVGAFYVGKQTIEILDGQLRRRHILGLLHECDNFAVGRLSIKPENTGQLLRRLRNIESFPFRPRTGALLVYEQCRDVAEFKSGKDYATLEFEPDDLYASMKVLFEHKGE